MRITKAMLEQQVHELKACAEKRELDFDRARDIMRRQEAEITFLRGIANGMVAGRSGNPSAVAHVMGFPKAGARFVGRC